MFVFCVCSKREFNQDKSVIGEKLHLVYVKEGFVWHAVGFRSPCCSFLN